MERTTGTVTSWPPKPDPQDDLLVFDTERNVVLSLDQATAALGPSAPAAAPAGDDRAEAQWLRTDSIETFAPETPAHTWQDTRERLIASAEDVSPISALSLRLRTGSPGVRAWLLRITESLPRVSLLRARSTTQVIMAVLALVATVQAAVLVYMVLTRGRSTSAATAPPPPSPAAAAIQQEQLVPIPEPQSPSETRSEAQEVAPTPKVPDKGARLIVQDAPSGAAVFVDGKRRGTAPVTLEDLSAGTHSVRIESNGSSVTEQVTLEAGSTTSLLMPVVQSSWVEIDSPIEVRIFEGTQLLGSSASGPVKVKPGTHRLELRNDALGYAGRAQVTVAAGEVSRVKPVLPEGVLQVNALPWAHVWIDGRLVGDTPLGTLRASVGPHEVRFRHPERGEQVRQVVVSALGPTRVSVDLR